MSANETAKQHLRANVNKATLPGVRIALQKSIAHLGRAEPETVDIFKRAVLAVTERTKQEEDGSISKGDEINYSNVGFGEGFEAALSDLRHRLVPVVPKFTNDDLDTLRRLVEQSQITHPRDRATFVDNVNAILDTHHLRFILEDGTLARLKLVTSSTLGSIQFGLPGRSRGFKRAFRVVKVEGDGPNPGI